MKKFYLYLSLEHEIRDLRDVREDHLLSYIEKLKQTKNQETVYDAVMSLKRSFEILTQEEKLLIDPAIRIKNIVKVRRIRDLVMSEEEVCRMLQTPDITHPRGVRNRAIMEVLYGTGIRIRELVNLELSDYSPEEKILLIREGKGKKNRIVPIGDKAKEFLDLYLKTARKMFKPRKSTRNIFVGASGRSMNVWNVAGQIRMIVKKSGIRKKITAHVFRHTFATHLLENGAGIREVQLLLGHNSIDSTRIYINLSQEYLRDEYMKYHPLENELFFDVNERERNVLNGELKDVRPLKKGLDGIV
jgi:integrase/recombinase XerD